jgi:uncharacterized repeat protein (TIGR03803 family)
MKSRKFLYASVCVFAAITLSLASAQAQTESILHSFNNGGSGGSPVAGLLIDASGNLYGTTEFGGSPEHLSDQGVVFRFALTAGRWQETVLMDFHSEDGSFGGLVQDAAGNLYGVSTNGGIAGTCPQTNLPGCGTVFEISPTSSGQWKRTQLYAFTGGADGATPAATLVFDSAGNLYGTAVQGGNLTDCSGSGCGVVFKLSPSSGGAWTETVLYAFTDVNDGAHPLSPVVFDSAGNLYGTTWESNPGGGAVYELSPITSGAWTETVIHTFGGSDGALPIGGLIFDPSGNLYGTTAEGGSVAYCMGRGCGTVFELSPSGSSWTETTIHTFTGGADGKNSQAGLARDSAGNLYGTTSTDGGLKNGIVFELSPSSGGTWTEKLLHAFRGPTTDGQNPGRGPVVIDAAGNLYGTTEAGGTLGYGVVYKIKP